MRTPNCQCIVCGKPLYRRPSELAKVRHVACMEHRALAQSISGVTEAQARGLSMGRVKGTNYRTGYKHREESKRKASESHKAWCAANPDRIAARGRKTRGSLHYRWKGGSSRLNTSIRQMSESRKWMDAVKARDGHCIRCGSVEDLEAHHTPPLADIVSSLGIRCRDDARLHAAVLWDVSNGETLCSACHDKEHGRSPRPRSQRATRLIDCAACGASFAAKPSRRDARFCSRACHGVVRSRESIGSNNPNWRGGKDASR